MRDYLSSCHGLEVKLGQIYRALSGAEHLGAETRNLFSLLARAKNQQAERLLPTLNATTWKAGKRPGNQASFGFLLRSLNELDARLLHQPVSPL
ncbi:MAG: hypothetical protein ACSLFH_11660, partial [Desulfuromonadales bacterium]